ncbi:MAG: hypothetical protein CVV25_08480 [Ignavibacteriae bacterium HGW-Ignavibacteriae-4]|jgi:hypothetical protein|nr:MAG: hypothetical protein CVV25_08480 [Ignavibacteriae bacterium HGW-Ignavibacteriae-4]
MKVTSIIIFIIIVGCNKSNENVRENNIVNELNFAQDSMFYDAVKNSNSLKELFKPVKVINLETTDESLMGEINSIIYLPDKQKIIVLDSFISQSVFVFNLEGQYLFKYGNIGDGPDEYRKPKCITYEDDIIVINGWDLKLLFYNLDGDLIKELLLNSNGLHFAIDKMILFKKDLYCYTNQPHRNIGISGHQNRVFKISNYKLTSSFGEPEETFHVWGGDLIRYQNKIIFSGVFDGNIYKIPSLEVKPEIFYTFGKMTDLSGLMNKSDSDKLNFVIKNINNFDYIRNLGVIKNLLFVQKNKFVSVIDTDGKMVNYNIKDDLYPPKGYRDFAMPTKVWQTYSDGIIMPSINQEKVKNGTSPNPSLIFYEFNHTD